MYSYYIVHANETAQDARVAQAIRNHGYTGEDVICIATNGYVGEIQTARTAQITLNNYNVSDINQLGQLLVDKATAQQAEQTDQAETPQIAPAE